MHISIHDVKKVKFVKVYKLGGSYACTLNVVSRDGKDEITLFANEPDRLEFVTVKDSSEFYDEPPLHHLHAQPPWVTDGKGETNE